MDSPKWTGLKCGYPGCTQMFTRSIGRTLHRQTHRVKDLLSSFTEHELNEEESPAPSKIISHTYLTGKPCDERGLFLEDGAPPPPPPPHDPKNWGPFNSQAHFELAEFFYAENKTSETQFDKLMQLLKHFHESINSHADSPFESRDDLCKKIDELKFGDVLWESAKLRYQPPPGDTSPHEPWMDKEYEIWFRNPKDVVSQIIGNSDFLEEINISPFKEFNKNGNHLCHNVMSSDWAWRQAASDFLEELRKVPEANGAMLVPVMLGSNKTTVSVATGQNKYWPLYITIGNVHNTLRRSQKGAVVLLGFLVNPKTSQKCENAVFRHFRRQVFHGALRHILQTLKEHAKKPFITRCFDGHFRRIVIAIGPYIGDYPEQVLVSAIVQGWCPKRTANPHDLDDDETAFYRSTEHTRLVREHCGIQELWDKYGIVGDVEVFTEDFRRANIYELITPDLLHQLTKGTFKDHLVTWIEDLLVKKYKDKGAKERLDEIDRRLAAVPLFSELRQFPEGRRFKQWTGDDSKALMKVYVAALEGILPDKIVMALSAFLNFAYLARRSTFTDTDITKLKSALAEFHTHRKAFQEYGVCLNRFSLPRQHALSHYATSIQDFGSPYGLCTSITESMHIKAVKQPWRRTNKNNPLSQILIINQRMDQLRAARSFFASRNMFEVGTGLSGLITELLIPSPLAPIVSSPSADSITDAIPNSLGVSPNGTVSNTEAEAGAEAESLELEAVVKAVCLSHLELVKKLKETVPSRWSMVEFSSRARETKTLSELGKTYPFLPKLVNDFLHKYRLNDMDVDFQDFSKKFSIYNSVISTFVSPADSCRTRGIQHELIRSVPRWQGGGSRMDTVLINEDEKEPGIEGMQVARILLFLLFIYGGTSYKCALVRWFFKCDDGPSPVTGMWRVKPDNVGSGQGCKANIEIIPLDSIIRACHLVPCYDEAPRYDVSSPDATVVVNHFTTLDTHSVFYVNHFADLHSYEII